MKKLIQVLSFLSLVVVFSVVSAKAQTVRQYEAQIPYDFNVGQKAYQAGDYVIKVSKVSLGVVSFSLEDENKNILQTILVRENGNNAQREPKLHFTKRDSQRFLTGMSMQEMGVSIIAPKNNKELLKAQGKPESGKDATVSAVTN